MLDPNALAQLRQLKQTIAAQKDRAEGIVCGSRGRSGFVRLDDGRDIYLSPEQMQRLFPDDRVAIEVVTGADGKPAAQLEQLLASPLREFTGQYVVRDNAHFVEPDLPLMSRWLFVPPKLRRGASHGDFVRARINRHPFEDGKPQARVEAIIGNAEQPFIETDYALVRFACPSSDLVVDERDLRAPDLTLREDLTHIDFITIDGADTEDMDDALHAEPCGDGWTLRVAIADPDAWIAPGSQLERAIASRGCSIYLPGRTLPMLPRALANEHCSLLPGVERAALVCTLQVASDGTLGPFHFSEARIRSRARLDYDTAAALIADGAEAPEGSTLALLDAVATALSGQRWRNHLLMPDRPDYRYEVDARGHLTAIRRRDKNAAHRLVEECMVAANRCAAEWLRNDDALFVNHPGFRPERLEMIRKLVASHCPALAAADGGVPDPTTLDGYIATMQGLENAANELPLRAVASRALARSQFSRRAAPHFGMGLPVYTTITSPIRKFGDLLLHRIIKAKLAGKSIATIDDATLTRLQTSYDRARQAARLAEQWLECLWLQQQPARLHDGIISHINSSGFTVRLEESGIEGFVDTRKRQEKFHFDQTLMRLTSGDRCYQLEQRVRVAVASIDVKRRSVQFELVDETPGGETV
jgi:VacB/RNase II family 3'-5' exoribonuclease